MKNFFAFLIAVVIYGFWHAREYGGVEVTMFFNSWAAIVIGCTFIVVRCVFAIFSPEDG